MSQVGSNAPRPECPDAVAKRLTYSLGSLAELDTQFLIAEMQGYAKYTDELKAKVVGLMAGIRAFSATLSKA